MAIKTKTRPQLPKVLIVDDREDNLLAYEVALREVPCELVKADSGLKALQQIQSNEFAVMLLDVQMPHMNGFETAQLVRDLPNGKLLPILFVTAGMHDSQMQKKAHVSGAIDFLGKPIDSEVLGLKVKLFIELFEARQIIRSQTESRTFLNGDGEVARLFRDQNWAATPLGGLNGWPQSLRTSVSIVLQSKIPMFITWGDERSFLYNDAYIPVLGNKHPNALGRSFSEVWAEIWPEISPLVDRVDSGESVYLEDLKLIINRHGYDEETYFTFSYSPLRGEDGDVGGLYCACVETTARIHSEQSLKSALDRVARSEETLDQIFNESPAFMSLVCGPDHKFERANQRYYEVTGRSDILGKTVAEAFPEIAEQGIIRLLDTVYETGQPYHGYEMAVMLNKKGLGPTEVFFDLVYQPMRDLQGKIYGIIAQGTDVTYQVQARRRSEESDRDLRLALESARMGTWRIKLKTNVIRVSPQFGELLGVPAENYDLNQFIFLGVHEEDRLATQERLKYAIENRAPYINEYRAAGPTGEMRWFSSRGNVVYSATGEPVSLAGVTVDITDRKLGELALQRNARLVEAMPQPFFAMDGNWNINYWNPAAAEVIGLESSEVIGRNMWAVFPDLENSDTGSNYKAALLYKTRTSSEDYYSSLEKWFQTWSFPFEDGVAVAFLDITDRKRNEKILADAKLAAERANELKSAFLANMSHEIRTPLGAMIGFADLLKDPDLEDTERSGYIDIITRNGNQLAVLINDILDLSKVESGHLSFENRETDPRRLVAEVVLLLNINAKEKNVVLQSSIESSVPALFWTDSVRLKQILVNIIGNAIKFTQAGSVTVRAFTVRNSAGNSLIAFEVTDTGIGIPDEKKTRLFQVFSQADESITRKYGGTGLGLALSRRLANGLGGDVILQRSSQNEGSTFIVTVENRDRDQQTIKMPPEPAPTPARQAALSSGLYLDSLRILLIEDSPDNQQLIWSILSKKGAMIEIAQNGLEGLTMALRGKYDIVLMDIQMPVMDGYTATQRLREQGFTKPIIALTAHAMSEIRQKCLQVGCTDHLPKPINAVDLVDVVSKHTTPVEFN